MSGGRQGAGGREEFIRGLLGRSDRAEAFSWLDESTEESYRTLGELATNEQSIDLVCAAYRAGASEVIAVEIDTYPDGGQNTGRLLVKLPDDAEKRRRVFAWCEPWADRLGFTAGEDVGQEYLFVMLD